MQLYDNKQTKIIFASEAPQDSGIEAITADQIAGLVADGYTVDASAESFVPTPLPADAASTDAAATTGEVIAPLPGADSPADASTVADPAAQSEAAPAADSATPLASSETASSVTEPGLTTEPAASAPAVVSGSETGSMPLAASSGTGSTAEVTQVGDQQVVTGLTQSENTLAGSTGNQLVNSTPTVDAPVLEGDAKTFANVENDLNPLVPAAGTEGAPASQLAAAAAEPEADPMPKESHLLLMEHKFAALRAKAQNEERIFLADIEEIYTHVKAVI